MKLNKLLHPTHTALRFCVFCFDTFMHKKRSAVCAAEQGVMNPEEILSVPSNHVFINAQQYLNIARITDGSGHLYDVSIAAVSNYAFSVELMLKALDTTLLPSLPVQDGVLSGAEIQTNIRGHNLLSIFQKLPTDVQQRLAKKFLEANGMEVEPLLSTCGDYFVLSRYFHEPQSKIAYRISDVRSLAEGVEHAMLSWNT